MFNVRNNEVVILCWNSSRWCEQIFIEQIFIDIQLSCNQCFCSKDNSCSLLKRLKIILCKGNPSLKVLSFHNILKRRKVPIFWFPNWECHDLIVQQRSLCFPAVLCLREWSKCLKVWRNLQLTFTSEMLNVFISQVQSISLDQFVHINSGVIKMEIIIWLNYLIIQIWTKSEFHKCLLIGASLRSTSLIDRCHTLRVI